ncbi:MAG: Gfo/Idh/MocA family oxidoreductase [Planctomycetota bacterium]
MKPTKTMPPQRTCISRRTFLRRAATGAALVTIVPRHVLGGQGHTAPSERLNIACIGVGGQGGVDADQVSRENIVALCDVHDGHAAGTFNRFPNAKRYRDFRRMLDAERGIDAVTVSTPDHTHAVIAITAIKMGKHVYCQKPLTHTVYEARQLALAAREYRVATQMGNQGQASEETRRLCEVLRDGAIGPVHEVHVWTDRPNNGYFGEYWPQGVERPRASPPVPSDLDWDLWLGPAPERPYHPAYAPFRWRGWWDFGTGALGDIGCHALDPVFRALELGAPLSVQAVSTRVNRETYPLGSIVTYRFAARPRIAGEKTGAGEKQPEELPPVTLTWYDGGLKPPRPEAMEAGVEMEPNGTLFVGEKGVMLGLTIFPAARRAEYTPPPRTLPRSIGHYEEWIEACKGGKPPGSNFDWAGPLAEAVLLGNVALRMDLRERLTREVLEWDPLAFRFSNVPEANDYLHRTYRDGWVL